MIVEAHHDLFGHRRSEQLARRSQRLGASQVHEHDVPSRQQLGIRPEHGVDRGDLAAVRLQSQQPGPQGRLQGPHVENDPRGAPQREIAKNGIRDSQGGRQDDEVMFQIRLAPIVDSYHAGGGAGGVGHFHRKSLGGQELDEPTAHLAAAADHQRASTRPFSSGHDARVLLGRER